MSSGAPSRLSDASRRNGGDRPAAGSGAGGISFSNARSREDRWVVDDVFRGRTTAGFFVEAGASDGIASNTYLLERYFGWTGLCCEPNAKFFELLRRNRSCHVRRCALSDADGTVEFIQAGWYGAVPDHVASIFSKRGQDLRMHENYRRDFDGTPAHTTRVAARTLASLLDEIRAPPVIDYLSLDVEGSELVVLRRFPFGRYRFLCASIETHFEWEGRAYDADHCGPVRDLMIANGYVLARQDFANDYFLHESLVR